VIREAVTRPSMRFLADVDASQDAGDVGLATHTAAQRAARPFNRGRRYPAKGPRHARELAGLVEVCDETIPFEVCEALAPLVVQLRNLDEAIAGLDRSIAKLAQRDETAHRPMTIPGFGPITASAMAATIRAQRYDLSRWACK
jgi:transposase